jgi:hypothetical protein
MLLISLALLWQGWRGLGSFGGKADIDLSTSIYEYTP